MVPVSKSIARSPVTRLLALSLICVALNISASPNPVVVNRSGQRLNISFSEGASVSNRDDVIAWLGQVSESLASVYGRWPRDEWNIEVDTTRRGRARQDPVPWAKIERGEINTIKFFIDGSSNRQELIDNWTAYHEVSHLLLPYRGQGDMWFSEGLASYYQNLLQGRVGLLTETKMWQKLHDGFMRGRNQNHRPDLALGWLSPVMRETKSFMRVYWSGVYYFLAADIVLREQGTSLDESLDKLNRCCADQKLSSLGIARKLDQVSGTKIFVPLYREVRNSKKVPEFESLYAKLSIELQRGRVILLDSNSAGANLRQPIYQGNP